MEKSTYKACRLMSNIRVLIGIGNKIVIIIKVLNIRIPNWTKSKINQQNKNPNKIEVT